MAYLRAPERARESQRSKGRARESQREERERKTEPQSARDGQREPESASLCKPRCVLWNRLQKTNLQSSFFAVQITKTTPERARESQREPESARESPRFESRCASGFKTQKNSNSYTNFNDQEQILRRPLLLFVGREPEEQGESQRKPERARESQREPESGRESQREPGRARESQRSKGRATESQREPGRARGARGERRRKEEGGEKERKREPESSRDGQREPESAFLCNPRCVLWSRLQKTHLQSSFFAVQITKTTLERARESQREP